MTSSYLFSGLRKNSPCVWKYSPERFTTFVPEKITPMITFELQEEEYIELIKLLKVTRVAESGGMAKQLVENGEVTRDGTVEHRKRAKIRKGETISALGQTIKVV